VPFLSQEHQQQVLTAVERAKQITMSELNAVIGQQRDLPRILQQMHAQQLPGGAPPTIPIAMHHPGLNSAGPSQLAALTNNSNNNNGPTTGAQQQQQQQQQQQLAMLTKQELMLHSRSDDGKGPNDDTNRHVSI